MTTVVAPAFDWCGLVIAHFSCVPLAPQTTVREVVEVVAAVVAVSVIIAVTSELLTSRPLATVAVTVAILSVLASVASFAVGETSVTIVGDMRIVAVSAEVGVGEDLTGHSGVNGCDAMPLSYWLITIGTTTSKSTCLALSATSKVTLVL